MASIQPPSVRLHNYFQGIGRVRSISYLERDHGAAVENRWSITVKIDERVMGSWSAARKATAREAAAEQALNRLGIQ